MSIPRDTGDDGGHGGDDAGAGDPLQSAEVDQIVKAVCLIIAEMPRIEKTETTSGPKYSYLAEESIVVQLRHLMPKHGLIVIPSRMRLVHRETYERSKGGQATSLMLRNTYTLYHTSGQWLRGEGLGEGADVGDKATNKGMTAAYKYFFREAFLVSGGHDPDATPSEEYARQSRPGPNSRPAGGQGQGRPAQGGKPKSQPAPIEERLKKCKDKINQAGDLEEIDKLLGYARDVFTGSQVEELEALGKKRGAQIVGDTQGDGGGPAPADEPPATEDQLDF